MRSTWPTSGAAWLEEGPSANLTPDSFVKFNQEEIQ